MTGQRVHPLLETFTPPPPPPQVRVQSPSGWRPLLALAAGRSLQEAGGAASLTVLRGMCWECGLGREGS